MTNRYLTDPAVKKRGWEWPVGIFFAFLAVIAIQVWIEDSPADENPVIWLLAHMTVVGLTLLPIWRIIRRRLGQRRAAAIADRLARCTQKVIPVHQLDKTLGVKNAWNKIGDLKRRGFLQRVEQDGTELILDQPTLPAEPVTEAAPEADDVILKIRHLNDEIDDERVSRRIEAIEQATAGILAVIDQHPDRADDARRFMNYYLPTTMKLLESYRLMEKQRYQGENIQASRQRIEAVLDKLVAAAQRQQDRMFDSEAMDVAAEIQVLETMMTSDGLSRTAE